MLAYGPSVGLYPLRAAMAAYYRRLGLPVEESDVLVTTGGSEALLFAFAAAADPGDEILTPEPCYPNYRGFAVMAGLAARTHPHVHRRRLRAPRSRGLRGGGRRRGLGRSSCATPRTPRARSIRREALRGPRGPGATPRALRHRRRGLPGVRLRRPRALLDPPGARRRGGGDRRGLDLEAPLGLRRPRRLPRDQAPRGSWTPRALRPGAPLGAGPGAEGGPGGARPGSTPFVARVRRRVRASPRRDPRASWRGSRASSPRAPREPST